MDCSDDIPLSTRSGSDSLLAERHVRPLEEVAPCNNDQSAHMHTASSGYDCVHVYDQLQIWATNLVAEKTHTDVGSGARRLQSVKVHQELPQAPTIGIVIDGCFQRASPNHVARYDPHLPFKGVVQASFFDAVVYLVV